MSKVLSFDIGGTSIKYGIVDFEGNIIWKSEMDTEAYLGGSHIVQKVKDKVGEIVQREQIIGVAISTAGIVDPVKGRIAEASDTIKGYRGQEIKETIENAFGIKTTVENDVNCAALGEMWKGAGKRKLNAFCMTIGTGVGGCAIVDKRVLSGNTFS
ncbi:MAG: ROK family protein, partial [Peptostreptococcaceae bacterium]